MAQERLTVRKIREILRLKTEAGISNRAIARACKLSNSTVGEYLNRAAAAGLHWPLPEGLKEAKLFQQLFPENSRGSNPERPLPNWESVRQELKRKGVVIFRPISLPVIRAQMSHLGLSISYHPGQIIPWKKIMANRRKDRMDNSRVLKHLGSGASNRWINRDLKIVHKPIKR